MPPNKQADTHLCQHLLALHLPHDLLLQHVLQLRLLPADAGARTGTGGAGGGTERLLLCVRCVRVYEVCVFWIGPRSPVIAKALLITTPTHHLRVRCAVRAQCGGRPPVALVAVVRSLARQGAGGAVATDGGLQGGSRVLQVVGQPPLAGALWVWGW